MITRKEAMEICPMKHPAAAVIAATLVRRDGMDEDEARDYVDNFEEEVLNDPLADPWTFEEEFELWFGLEPDYLMDWIMERM